MSDRPAPDAPGAARRLIARLTGSAALSDLAARAVHVRWFDRALALAARLFIAVIPLAILLTAFTVGGGTFADRLVESLQLSGAGREAARALFAAPGNVRAGVSLFSLLVLCYALSSYCGELQRMYRACWRLGRVGPDGFAGDVRRRAVWVPAFLVYLGLSSVLAEAQGDGVAAVARDLARVSLAVGFFAWTPYVLLDRRVPGRRLWPTAVLSAAALGMLTAMAPLYVPPIASSNAETYGLIGFTFTFFSYLFAQGFLVVGAGIVGSWLGSRDAWGRAAEEAG